MADGETMTTVEALRRLAAGRDVDAWAAILQLHGPDVVRVARRLTRDDMLAEA